MKDRDEEEAEQIHSGEELEKLYLDTVRAYEGVVDAMIEASRRCSGHFVEPRRSWATILFTRLCVLSQSVRRLLPSSSLFKDDEFGWDFSSIATLVRTVLECDLMYFYLGIEDPGEDEWAARLDLMQLHDATARVAMFKTLLPSQKNAEGIGKQREEVIERLRKNSWFKGLPEKQQAHFLKGENIRFEIQDEVLTRMGLDVPEFRSWYAVLSSHAHTYALAFHRMSMDERGRGIGTHGEKSWIVSSLYYLMPFLRGATEQLLKLFPDVDDPPISRARRPTGLPADSPLLRT